jgi:hypothetical protein
MTSLAEVHLAFKKWLFISDDTVIDVLLATYLTHKKPGTPVWVFVVDSSGETKTEMLRPFFSLPNTILVSDLSKGGIISCNMNNSDLYTLLDEKDSVLVIPDIANLSSKKKEEKSEIFGMLRDLYDGILSRRTGFNVKETLTAHTAMIAGATKNFRSQSIISNQLGTRELLYSPIHRSEHMQQKLDAALKNDNYEEEMRNEIEKAVHSFMQDRELKQPEITPEAKTFLSEEAMRLRLIRATADIDWYTGCIRGEIDIETPTRAIKQFSRLFEGLYSLDQNYSAERMMKIIKQIVNSSGNQLRMQIMNFLNADRTEHTLNQISTMTKTNKKLVSVELEFLWKLDWLNKRIESNSIGGETHFYSRNL